MILYEVSIPKAEQLKCLLSRAGVGAEQSCPVCGVAPPASSLPPHLALRAHVCDHLCYRPFGCPHCAEYSAPSCLELDHHYKLKHFRLNPVATVRLEGKKEEEIDELLQGKTPSSNNASHPTLTGSPSSLSLEGRPFVKSSSPQSTLDIPKQEPTDRPIRSSEQESRGSLPEKPPSKRKNEEPLVVINDVTKSRGNSESEASLKNGTQPFKKRAKSGNVETPREICHICAKEMKATSMDCLIRHVLTHVDEPHLFQCSACNHKTHRMDLLKSHWGLMHYERDWDDNSFKKILNDATRRRVNAGFKEAFPSLEWKGNYAGLDFTIPSNQRGIPSEKKANVDASRMECHICSKKIQARETIYLIQHVLLAHVENPHLFQCSACDYKACRRDKIKNHRNKAHNLRDWDDSCFKETLNDATRRRVNACFKAAFPSVQWSGRYRGLDFTSEASFKRGTLPCKIRAKSGGFPTSSVMCHICSKQIKSASSLKFIQHTLTHVDEPHLFQCSACDYKTYRMALLKQHWRVMHYERDWDENSFKEILNDATRRRANARFKEAFPSLEWNGKYERLNFTVE